MRNGVDRVIGPAPGLFLHVGVSAVPHLDDLREDGLMLRQQSAMPAQRLLHPPRVIGGDPRDLVLVPSDRSQHRRDSGD
jgi:hypothetical protein